MANAKGHATCMIAGQEFKIRLGYSEIADADEYMMREFGRSFAEYIAGGALNFHLLRVAFYFGTREHHKDIRSVKQAGRVLDGADMEAVGAAIGEALKASGLAGDDEGEA